MLPPLADNTASAFAVSIGLPPPNPMMPSARWALTRSSPPDSDVIVGSGTVSEDRGLGAGRVQRLHQPFDLAGVGQVPVGDQHGTPDAELCDNRAEVVDGACADLGEAWQRDVGDHVPVLSCFREAEVDAAVAGVEYLRGVGHTPMLNGHYCIGQRPMLHIAVQICTCRLGVMQSADNLRFFLEVARTGRLNEAARNLAVDHTTVGRRITALEKAFGERLFDRSPADGI